MNKKVLWILMLSLAANVFFGVMVGSQAFRGPKGPPPRPERILEEMAATLPSADAAILPDAPFRQHERFRQALLAEPFDVEEFRRINDEFHARRERMGRIIDAVLSEAVPKISPEGRRRLAEFRPPRPK
jgi:hypothetical protein